MPRNANDTTGRTGPSRARTTAGRPAAIDELFFNADDTTQEVVQTTGGTS